MAKRVPLFETDRLTCYALTVEDYASFASGIEPIWGSFTNNLLAKVIDRSKAPRENEEP
jgi:hypothetical protein